MMATTAIGENLHTVQPHGYVRTVCRCVGREGGNGEECEWVDVGIHAHNQPSALLHPLHLFPVKSSSQVSQPMHVSIAAMTASPKGTMYCEEGGGEVRERGEGRRGGGEEGRGKGRGGCEEGGEERRDKERIYRNIVPRLTAYCNTVGQSLANT